MLPGFLFSITLKKKELLEACGVKTSLSVLNILREQYFEDFLVYLLGQKNLVSAYFSSHHYRANESPADEVWMVRMKWFGLHFVADNAFFLAVLLR